MAVPSHPLMPRYLAAQLAGDRREALRLVVEEGLAQGVSAERIHLEVVAEAQREIGRLWQENEISIADEHQATAISQMVLSHVYGALDRAPSVGKRIVVACVDGEQHDMSARIAADMLEAHGFDVTFLGPSVPAPSLIAKMRSVRADAVALALTMTFHAAAARETIAQIRAAFGSTFPILVGGEAASTLENPIPDATVSTGTALDLVATVKKLLDLET